MNAKRLAWFLKATGKPTLARAAKITFYGDAIQGAPLQRVATWLGSIPHKAEFGLLLEAVGPRLSLYVVSSTEALLRSFTIMAKQSLPHLHSEAVAYPALRSLVQQRLGIAVVKPTRRALRPFHEDVSATRQARTPRGTTQVARPSMCHHDNVLANLLNDVAETTEGTRRLLYVTLRADRRRFFDGPKYRPPREEPEGTAKDVDVGFLTLLLSGLFSGVGRLLRGGEPEDVAAYEAKGTASRLFWCGILYVETGDLAGVETRLETLRHDFHPLAKADANAYAVQRLNPESKRAARYLARMSLGQGIRDRSFLRRHLNWAGEAAELLMPPADPTQLPQSVRRTGITKPMTAAQAAQAQSLSDARRQEAREGHAPHRA